jgi:multicomponent Na+:H+ antiporter subunit E
MTPKVRSPLRGRFAPIAVRLAMLVFLWVILAERHPWSDWPLAVAVVAAALGTSLVLRPRERVRVRPLAVLRFVPWFLAQSLAGGIDVARRALSPRMPLQAGFVEVPLAAGAGLRRVAFVWVVSLLPGTAGVHLHERGLRVHVLDCERHTLGKLRALEARVNGLFVAP